MATLEQLRRANGDRIENERRANGDRIEQERRAAGDRLIEERTGRSVAEDINRLVTPPKQRRSLPTVPPVGPLPASQGRGEYERKGTSTGGGIASPLTEMTKVVGGKTVPDNELWPAGYPSSDGLLVLPAWKTVRFTDANGAEVVFEYANPAGVGV